MGCDVTADPGGELDTRKGREDPEGRKRKLKLLSTPSIAEILNRKLFDISILQF